MKRILAVALFLLIALGCSRSEAPKPPNILIAISDDQSWAHTGIAGDPMVKTPVYDGIARDGILFTHAFSASPSCSPSRSAMLTGRHIWQLGAAANNHGPLDSSFGVYPDLLEDAGYHVGFIGKGWGPGTVAACGRTRNPAGNAFEQHDWQSYMQNFVNFLDSLPDDKPFCLWFGSTDPHFPFTPEGEVLQSGMNADDVALPAHIPDAPALRRRMVGYYFEIQRFDRHLGEMLKLLEERGLLSNTLVVATSDNGIDLPRGKVNLYDYGTRMPLAVMWRDRIPAGRVVDNLVSLTDWAPTFLSLAGVPVPVEMTGRDISDWLLSDASGFVEPTRGHVLYGRERHSPYRVGMASYPSRAIRTKDYLYIRNFHPDRWPAGVPPYFGDSGACHTVVPIVGSMPAARRERYMALNYNKRPAEELYDLATDPEQLVNVAEDAAYREVCEELATKLEAELRATGDPRIMGEDGGWDDMPWLGPVRTKLMDPVTLQRFWNELDVDRKQ